jgi:hypothetical protein
MVSYLITFHSVFRMQIFPFVYFCH